MKFNIYCDESCHLEHDNQRYMVLGGIICEKNNRKAIKRDILNIKKRFNIPEMAEIKWNKVSPSKLDYYKELVNYFFGSDELRFRAIIIDKTQLKHELFNQTHDDWYYKMYYHLLINLVEPKQENYIYLDIKDTKSARKVEGLKKYLVFKLMDYECDVIKNIQSINSEESSLMQLADLLIGAISYRNRKIYNDEKSSWAKKELMMHVINRSGYTLVKSTVLSEKKFNLFCINLEAGGTVG